MMSPDDAAKYLDFLENGSKEGLTSAELADALLVSQKVGYEDVWDLRNPCDVLESGKYSILSYEDAENIAFDAIHGPNNADASYWENMGMVVRRHIQALPKIWMRNISNLIIGMSLQLVILMMRFGKLMKSFWISRQVLGGEIYLSHNPENI